MKNLEQIYCPLHLFALNIPKKRKRTFYVTPHTSISRSESCFAGSFAHLFCFFSRYKRFFYLYVLITSAILCRRKKLAARSQRTHFELCNKFSEICIKKNSFSCVLAKNKYSKSELWKGYWIKIIFFQFSAKTTMHALRNGENKKVSTSASTSFMINSRSMKIDIVYWFNSIRRIIYD